MFILNLRVQECILSFYTMNLLHFRGQKLRLFLCHLFLLNLCYIFLSIEFSIQTWNIRESLYPFWFPIHVVLTFLWTLKISSHFINASDGDLLMFLVQISEWGRMSMCDAERRLLANALLDISNQWFILLSESCIPLYKFSFVYHYIMKAKHSFVGAFDDPGPYGRGRYNKNMAPLVNITKWRKGSQWFEVNRKLAVNIVEDTTFYPKFEQYCRPACYVDEHYFPTMLTIQAANVLANRSITWVDWSRGGAHPATFGRNDITEEFFNRVRGGGHKCLYNNRNSSVCVLFARKFAPSALEPLLHMVDSKVLDFWQIHSLSIPTMGNYRCRIKSLETSEIHYIALHIMKWWLFLDWRVLGSRVTPFHIYTVESSFLNVQKRRIWSHFCLIF